jgi:uncharacterized phage protein (TIGR02218 family)
LSIVNFQLSIFFAGGAMRKVTGAFPTWSDAIALADLWTITTIAGDVLRWTSADVPITTGGNTFLCGPIIKRGGTRMTSTLEVDALDVTIETGESVTLAGIPLAHAAANGALDGATVKLERAFMQTWGVVSATVHLFEGRVAAIDPTHTEVAIKVKSLLEILDAKWPRNIYQPACCHQLYSAGCGVARAPWLENGAATGGDTQKINWPNNKPSGHYDQGVIVFTSGQNTGARRTIKSSDSNGLSISLPLAYPAKAGDAFQVAPGCDKLQSTCGNKFGNLNRFRGFPYVPPPETTR